MSHQPVSQTKVRGEKRTRARVTTRANVDALQVDPSQAILSAEVEVAEHSEQATHAALTGHAAHIDKMRPVSSLSAASRPARESSQQSKQRLEVELEELLAVPAALVSQLPVPACLRLKVPGAPVPVVFWTGNISALKREAAPVLADIIVFDGAELEAMVCAAEADRLWHADLLGLCFEKWRRPDVPVRAAELLDGANPEPEAGWSLGRVLSRLGVEVESIALDEEPVARPLHAAA